MKDEKFISNIMVWLGTAFMVVPVIGWFMLGRSGREGLGWAFISPLMLMVLIGIFVLLGLTLMIIGVKSKSKREV